MIPQLALTDPSSPADQRAEDAQYYRRVLHEWIDMGTDFGRAVHKQATAETDEPAAILLDDAAVAFDLLSRAVRRTVALARKVTEPPPVRIDSGGQRAAARRQIIREVEDAIQREADGADAEALEDELRERLDGPELDDEINGRPAADVINDICRDLGLGTLLGNHPWKRRTPPDIVALCARAAQPGAAPGQAAASPGAACYVPDRPKPPPYSREGAIELMHQLLELRPPIRGP